MLAAFNQDDACLSRVNGAKVLGHSVPGYLSQGPSEFYARWPPADDHKRQPGAAPLWVQFALCGLVCQEHTPANFEGIFDALQPWCILRPVVMPKV
jgi:hypothetical protein